MLTYLVSTRVIDLRYSRHVLLWVILVGSLLLEHDNLVILLVVLGGEHGG